MPTRLRRRTDGGCRDRERAPARIARRSPPSRNLLAFDKQPDLYIAGYEISLRMTTWTAGDNRLTTASGATGPRWRSTDLLRHRSGAASVARLRIEGVGRFARQDGRADEHGAHGHQHQSLVQAEPVDEEGGA